MERKGLHILNTVIVGIILLFILITLLGGFLFSTTTGNSSNFFEFGGGTWIVIFIFIISVIYFIFLIYSFKRCNLDNKLFKWADALNVISFFGSILVTIVLMIYLSATFTTTGNFALFDQANSFLDVLSWIAGIIYVISFAIFLIGYFGNKR